MTPREHLVVRTTLEAVRGAYVPAKQTFVRETEQARTELLERLAVERRATVRVALSRLSDGAASNARVVRVAKSLCQYADASDWNFVDVALLMACLDHVPESVLPQIAGACLSFHALRMVDDVLDGHLTYKGSYPTMLGDLASDADIEGRASAATLLAALLLLCEGLGRWPCAGENMQRTVLGALHELLVVDPPAEYGDVVIGKMVAYGLVLYGPVIAAIETQEKPKVEAFLRLSFRVAQLANDLLDRLSDRDRNQPNFWNMVSNPTDRFLADIGELSAMAELLPGRYRPYGFARVADLAGYALQGLDSGAEDGRREDGRTWVTDDRASG